MIVNLNGQFWYDTKEQVNLEEMVMMHKSKKLKAFALTLWTTSGLLFTQKAHAESFYESMQPLTHVFQDIALGLGILFAIAGFILLGFKKRMGTATLKRPLWLWVECFWYQVSLCLLRS